MIQLKAPVISSPLSAFLSHRQHNHHRRRQRGRSSNIGHRMKPTSSFPSSFDFMPLSFFVFSVIFCLILHSSTCLLDCNCVATVSAFSLSSAPTASTSFSSQHQGTKNQKNTSNSKNHTANTRNHSKILLVDNSLGLSAGEMKPIQVNVPRPNLVEKENDERQRATTTTTARIGKFAFRQGLPKMLTTKLQQFIAGGGGGTRTNDSSVTSIDEMFRVLLTIQPLEPGETLKINTSCGEETSESQNHHHQQQEWNIQRPRSHWFNNMHWIAPANEVAEQAFRDLLQKGGFDQIVLRGIAEEMNFDVNDLFIHHLFFIGVSHASNSYTHVDFDDTNGRGFTVLFPLRLPGDDEPELGFQERNNNGNNDGKDTKNDNGWYGWYKYKMDEAALVGDGQWHVTADCSYRNDYRICANIYVCHKSHPILQATNVKGVYSNAK